MTAGWERKVDHRLRLLAEQWPDVDSQRRVAVFVRLAGEPGPDTTPGLAVGTRAGEVVSGSVALADVPRLAAAPAVSFLEMSRDIRPDPD